ncbi:MULTISPECIES: hypothetical protein [unclassified Moorena]|uniref:hypothetical protein n=1 Tax=unclassified Moorena TaxID=2683338 RepID=UPI0013BE2966|nr:MULTISPECIES: hypothetical protein [unclassified Moorena]NEP36206.1 hypothetical protein [Moorena sp. SIO3B2]NEQ10028.1 hypothetical protein [Moorena sp. SIO4E2]
MKESAEVQFYSATRNGIGKRQEARGKRQRCATRKPWESVKAGNGENYPGNYCVF